MPQDVRHKVYNGIPSTMPDKREVMTLTAVVWLVIGLHLQLMFKGAIMAIAYAQSQWGITCIFSPCGSTEPSEKIYTSYFEDHFGNVN